MNPIDRHARKQVLLTRIAFERVELQRDLEQLRQAARVPQLLRGLVGASLGRSLFGAGGAATGGSAAKGWLGLALSLLRRYRVAAVLLGAVTPLLRGRGGWRRL
ncbi:MAG: hypothetical protein KGI87_10645, partial [Burkholderiales bacterium]|nr:hypothetical protein [Burkholderiales bacterium]